MRRGPLRAPPPPRRWGSAASEARAPAGRNRPVLPPLRAPGRASSAPRGPGSPSAAPREASFSPPGGAPAPRPFLSPGRAPRGPLFPQRAAGTGSLGALRRAGCVVRRPGAARVSGGGSRGQPASPRAARTRACSAPAGRVGISVRAWFGKCRSRGWRPRRSRPPSSPRRDPSTLSPAWKASSSR